MVVFSVGNNRCKFWHFGVFVSSLHPVLVQAMIIPKPPDFAIDNTATTSGSLLTLLLQIHSANYPKYHKLQLANLPLPADIESHSSFQASHTNDQPLPDSDPRPPQAPPPPPKKVNVSHARHSMMYTLATHTSKAHRLIESTWSGQWNWEDALQCALRIILHCPVPTSWPCL